MHSLEGVRVLEVSTRLSGAFAGLVLALQGADVAPVQGVYRGLDALESAYYDRFRAGAVSDWRAAIESSDVLLCDADVHTMRAMGLPTTERDAQALSSGLVVVACTALGLFGPHHEFAMDDLTEWAAGGLGYVTRRPVDGAEGEEPVCPPGKQPELLGGLAAATGAFAGLRLARASGRAVVVDVSRQEVQVAMLHGIVPPFVWNGTVFGSPGSRPTNIGMLLPTADGAVYLRTVEAHQWQSLAEWIGDPEVANTDAMARNREEVRDRVAAWSKDRATQELYEEGQRRRIPLALPRTLHDVLVAPQFEARAFWDDIAVDDTTAKAPSVPLLGRPPLAVARTHAVPARLPPPVGAPLHGVRVVDMGWSWAGPYAGMILADLGAEVIKVESGARIDVLRMSGAFADGVAHYERSGYYSSCNRGKRSVTLNLKHPEAKELLLALLRVSHAALENFSPRVLPSLGLGADLLLEANPGLVLLSMSGYGATGPEGEFVAYGDHLLHASGLAAATGEDGDPDTKIGIFYGDPVGGLYGALGILAGLAERERTGLGCHLDLSQIEGLASLIPTELMAASTGRPKTRRRVPDARPGRGFYRCRGPDAWVAVSAAGEWPRVRAVLDAAGIAPGTEPDDAAIRTWAAERSPWEVTTALQRVGVRAYPLQPAPRLVFDEHLAARRMFPIVHHPVAGPGPVTGTVFRLGDGEDGVRARGPAPLMGEGNEHVFKGILGVDDAEYGRLIAGGAIA